ncbi:MAG: serine hydrolase [bacterium]|jgi:CubicO group peptidase (beta-lactamase class C family)
MSFIKGRNILLVVLLVISLFFVLMPDYTIRALWYQEPNIDDYKIFENRIIKAGDPEPWPLHEAYNKQSLSDEVLQRIMEYDPVAFLIIRDGKILHESYWDGYDENSISNSFSMAKSIVSLLVGAALDDGDIRSLDQPVGTFIPSFNEGGKEKITIRHLLTMSAGTDWDEAYASLFSPTTESYYGEDLVGMVNKLKAVKEPGKTFYYASIETEVLAMVVEEATGMNISEYTSEKYWKHMGPRHDALWNLDSEDGMEKAYCCFNSNARDFARWGQLVLNDGTWDGNQLISESYLQEAFTPATYLVDETGSAVDYYGYQWWIIDYKGYNIPYMRGILGQYVFPIKEKNAVVVRLGHKRSDELIGPNRKDIFVYLDAAFELLD